MSRTETVRRIKRGDYPDCWRSSKAVVAHRRRLATGGEGTATRAKRTVLIVSTSARLYSGLTRMPLKLDPLDAEITYANGTLQNESGVGFDVGNLVTTNGGGPAELVLAQAVPLDRSPAAVYLASLAPSSRRTQGQALNAIAGILTGVEEARSVAWHLVRYQHAQAIRARLAESYRPATANRMLCALRGVLREAWRLGQVSADDYHRSVDLKPVRGTTLPAGRTLTTGEIHALFSACCDDGGPAGVRDAAILGVLFGAGLRRQEVVLLDVDDFDAQSGELRVQGKGSKEREAFATNGNLEALSDWLAIRGVEAGPLFVPVNKSGRLGTGRLTAQAVYNLLRKRAAQAGVKAFSPHDLRRTFCTMLLDAGADVAVVAGLMGHASVDTTRRYDRRDAKARKRAAEMLHVPYSRVG